MRAIKWVYILSDEIGLSMYVEYNEYVFWVTRLVSLRRTNGMLDAENTRSQSVSNGMSVCIEWWEWSPYVTQRGIFSVSDRCWGWWNSFSTPLYGGKFSPSQNVRLQWACSQWPCSLSLWLGRTGLWSFPESLLSTYMSLSGRLTWVCQINSCRSKKDF